MEKRNKVVVASLMMLTAVTAYGYHGGHGHGGGGFGGGFAAGAVTGAVVGTALSRPHYVEEVVYDEPATEIVYSTPTDYCTRFCTDRWGNDLDVCVDDCYYYRNINRWGYYWPLYLRTGYWGWRGGRFHGHYHGRGRYYGRGRGGVVVRGRGVRTGGARVRTGGARVRTGGAGVRSSSGRSGGMRSGGGRSGGGRGGRR